MRTITHADLHPMSKTQQIKKPGTAKPKPQEVVVTQAPAPIINIDMSKFNDDTTAMLRTIADAVKAQQPAAPAAPVDEWKVDITRDGNNLLKSFTLKAIRGK